MPALTRVAANGLAFLFCVGCCLVSRAEAQTASLENAIKATYLYKFGPFVEWPRSAISAASGGDALICAIGEDTFGDTLDRALKGQRLGDRPIEVRRYRTVPGDVPCQIMYIAGSAEQSVADALAAVRGRPVLTVTDEATTSDDAKGIIHFAVRENRVRFLIDDQAASENGLSISSKLLSLAASVRPRTRRDPP